MYILLGIVPAVLVSFLTKIEGKVPNCDKLIEQYLPFLDLLLARSICCRRQYRDGNRHREKKNIHASLLDYRNWHLFPGCRSIMLIFNPDSERREKTTTPQFSAAISQTEKYRNFPFFPSIYSLSLIFFTLSTKEVRLDFRTSSISSATCDLSYYM